MTFHVYQTDGDNLVNTGLTFSLAGYNLIYHIWEARGNPTNQGWHITRDDLALNYEPSDKAEKPYRFVIDYDPKSKRHIGLIELLDIYVYTFSALGNGKADWSPMMLRFQDAYYKEFDNSISDEEKEKQITRIPEPDSKEDFVEFLYLSGSDKSWNWGMNGMTNAAFIQGSAREYFRQYF